MFSPSHFCDMARCLRARQGAAGIRMASHTVAANAFVRHDESKAAAHGQPEPPPMASFEPRPRHCGSAQATHSPLRDWGPAASHQLRTGTGDSVPSHWLGTDWGLGTQSPARGLGLGTESSADARDCCGTGHWSPGLSHLKILILTAMSLGITT